MADDYKANTNKSAEEESATIRINESMHINTDGIPSIYHQGVAGSLMTAKEAKIKMKSGVYGLFIMLQHQAFFFPVSAQMTRAHQSMLFQQIDATRKACLDALKTADGNISQAIAEVILVSPPPEEDDDFVGLLPEKATASFKRDTLSKDAKDRIALKVKQSLNTVGLEPQWREQFQSIVPPEPGYVPTLHLQQDDIDDDEDGGSSGGTGKPKHTWTLLYTTETADGPITEEIHKYKHIPEADFDQDISKGPGRKL